MCVSPLSFHMEILLYQHGQSAINTSRILFLLASTLGASCGLAMNHVIHVSVLSLSLSLPPSIIIVNCICPPGALIWLINLFLFLFLFLDNTGLLKFENDVNLICKCFLLIRLRTPLRNMFSQKK
jgi:hypothetical protein